MSTPGRRRGLSDEELAAVVRWVARAWLEVDRGQRPVQAVARFLSPTLAYGLANATRPVGAPAVTARDVGGVRLERVGRWKAFAVVAVRHLDGWGAMMFTLRRDESGAWRIIEICRPDRRPVLSGVAGHEPRGTP